MAIDVNKWTELYGGAEAVAKLKEAEANAPKYEEVTDGTYRCTLKTLEMGESKAGAPMVKASFVIAQGEQYAGQCVFYNGVMAARNPEKSGYCIKNVIDFLRSMRLYDDSDVEFDGDYGNFITLLEDLKNAAVGVEFNVNVKTENGYKRLKIVE